MSSYPTSGPPRTAGFGRGLAAAVLAAIVGAFAWAIATDITNYHLGIVAVGIGFIVGLAAERWGGGDSRLPVLAAVIALAGCFGGDLLATVFVISSDAHISIGTVLQHTHFVWQVYTADFRALDFVFYAIAAYEGFRFAQRGVLRARAAAAVALAQQRAAAAPAMPPPPPVGSPPPPPPTQSAD